MLLSADRIVLALNETAANAIGKPPSEIIGTPIDSYFNAEVIAHRRKQAVKVAQTGKPVQFESERDGKQFEHHFYPVFDDRGRVTRVAAYSRDVTIRKQAQKELEAKSYRLEEMNAALKILLNQREVDRKEMEEKVLSNVRVMILPVLAKLKACKSPDEGRAYLDLLETGIKEIVSPFMRGLEAYRLTPREMEIVSLVREGRSTKEIAKLLNVCKGAVDIYRHSIRKKLGLRNAKKDLRSHLLTLAD